MVGQRVSLLIFIGDNNGYRVANKFSDKYCVNYLHGLVFCIKEQFWSSHGI